MLFYFHFHCNEVRNCNSSMYRLSRDVFPSCFRKIGRLINEDVVIASSQLTSRRRRRKLRATRRRISRIILASVVNASNHRHRGLPPAAIDSIDIGRPRPGCANQLHVTAAIDRREIQTNGQPDTRLLHV